MNLHPAVGTLALLLSASLASAQSLGEVARREEARRKTIKAPAKVYTNADLHGGGRPASPPPAASTPEPTEPLKPGGSVPVVDAKPPEDTTSPAQAKDEAYWRDRITQARTDVDRTRTYLDALQSRVNALTTDFVNRDDPAQRSLIEADRNKALGELGRLKIELEKQLKAIDDIQEEARHAGVPPGWLR